jgi:hypothetical protein
MKKVLYWVLGIVIVIQFIRPDFQNTKVDETITLKADTKIMSVLQKSCYDCHSQETKFPWYRNIAPVSWVIADHINQGRKALDFSNWENIDPKLKLERLERAKQVIYNHRMPKSEYIMMHENAVLTSEEKQLLEQFFDSQIQTLH